MSEAITNRDSFQSFQKAIVVLFFLFDFDSNCWSIFACIALPENQEILRRANIQLIKATIAVLIKLLKGIVEIIRHFCH